MIVEVVVHSTEYTKSHMVEVQGEAIEFRGFVCVYKILTRINQHIKVEETMVEFMKHMKYLESLKM